MPASNKLQATMDPAELQRRIADDKAIKRILNDIAEIEGRVAGRQQQQILECKPYKEKNAELSRDRRRLLRQIKTNEARMRMICERIMIQDHRKLVNLNMKLGGRKRTLKNIYVKQLLCVARQELNKALPIKTYIPEGIQ